MEIQILFNYRQEGGKDVTLANGETASVKVIRRGPRGIVAVVNDGPIVLWDNSEADAHISDSEQDLLNKVVEKLGENA